MRLYLVSSNAAVCGHWEKCLSEAILKAVDVRVHKGRLDTLVCETGTTCFVSPANSYASMGEGYDLALSKIFGFAGFEAALQSAVNTRFHGYVPVGDTLTVDFAKHAGFEHSVAYRKYGSSLLMVVPTMVVPGKIETPNAFQFVFDRCWSVLCQIPNLNVENLVLPAFGAGYGELDLETVARATVHSIETYFSGAVMEKNF